MSRSPSSVPTGRCGCKCSSCSPSDEGAACLAEADEGLAVGAGGDPCSRLVLRPSRPTRCRPGTTARPSRRSSISSPPRPRRGTRLRAAGRAARHLRPGRHAVGRAADLFAGGVRARPGGGAGARASGVEDEGAVQVGARRRQGGDGEVHLARPRGDRVRHAYRDDRRGVPRDRDRRGRRPPRTIAGSGPTPS